jgi:hypothetical protein
LASEWVWLAGQRGEGGGDLGEVGFDVGGGGGGLVGVSGVGAGVGVAEVAFDLSFPVLVDLPPMID